MRPTVVPADGARGDRPGADRLLDASERDTTCFDTQIANQGTDRERLLLPGGRLRRHRGDVRGRRADDELTLGPNESAHIGTIVTAHGDVEPVAPRVQCAPVQT